MKIIFINLIGFMWFDCFAVDVVNFKDKSPANLSNKVNNKSISNNQKQVLLLSCWKEAEYKFGVPTKLLHSVAKVETGFNVKSVGRNKNGSYDIGLMQINSSWLPKLAKYNITEQSLYDPCTNIMVGAWIMSDNIKRLGYNWNAVGAYNANSLDKRGVYAKKVQKAVAELGYN